MGDPLVSICIPTYNGTKYLEECLNSAINQTYKNIEILIVDDNSIDNTWKIISSYLALDKRIRAYKNDKNEGLVNNWNKCLELATGEWIKFLFQDDRLTNDCIETMINETNSAPIVVSKRDYIFENGIDEEKKGYYKNEVITFEKLGVLSTRFITPTEISSMAANNICLNFIGEPTNVLFRRDIINTLGNFNADFSEICDLEYFLRIASQYGITYVAQPLTSFRIHSQSTTSSNLSSNQFALSHIDTIVMVHQLLFNDSFKSFRSSISIKQKTKLKLFFRARVFEAYLNAKNSTQANLNKFTEIADKYPEIKGNINAGFFSRLLLIVVKLKRKLRTH